MTRLLVRLVDGVPAERGFDGVDDRRGIARGSDGLVDTPGRCARIAASISASVRRLPVLTPIGAVKIAAKVRAGDGNVGKSLVPSGVPVGLQVQYTGTGPLPAFVSMKSPV